MEIVQILKRKYEIAALKEMQACADWFVCKYLDPEVDITISVDKRMSALCGECYSYGKKSFDIYISGKLSYKETMITLCHELWHCKQYYEGKLRDMGFGKTKWERKTYKDVAYSEQPWEIDAHKMETQVLGFWKHTKIGKTFYQS